MFARLGLVLLLAVFAQARQVYDRPVFVKDQPILTKDVSHHIINGQDAARGQFPYQIGLKINGRSFCGGSIIDKSWVLTAAHCVDGGQLFTVYLGALEMNQANEPGRVTLESREGFAHEKYDPSYLDNDVGLVKLPSAIEPNEQIAVIALPPKSFDSRDFTGQPVRVSGWGKTSDASNVISNKLQFVDLTVVSNDECRKYYGDVISSKIVCATGPDGKSTCNGDSGGPLVITDKETNKTSHFAVVSFVSSAGCASGLPSGYDRSYKFLDWIHEKTGIPIQD